jgi:hypothetical protein
MDLLSEKEQPSIIMNDPVIGDKATRSKANGPAGWTRTKSGRNPAQPRTRIGVERGNKDEIKTSLTRPTSLEMLIASRRLGVTKNMARRDITYGASLVVR